MEYLPLGALIAFGVAVFVVSRTEVRPWERVVIFRMGRPKAGDIRGPGVTYLMPILDTPVRVDMRDQSLQIEQPAVAPANASADGVTVDLRWRVADPWSFTMMVADTSLRVPLELFLKERLTDAASADPGTLSATIDTELRAVLSRWGVEVIDLRIGVS